MLPTRNPEAPKDMIVSGFADSQEDTNRAVFCLCTGLTSATGVPQFVNGTASAFPLQSEPRNGASGLLLADYDNDGKIDIYVSNPSCGGWARTNQLYRGIGIGVLDDVSIESGLVSSENRNDETISGAWGDYDGDGFVDLLTLRSNSIWPCTSPPWGEEITLYHNVSDGTVNGREFVDVTDGSGLNDLDDTFRGRVLSALWVDFDQDHDLDLVLVQSVQNGGVFGPGQYSKYYKNIGDGTFENATSERLPDHADFWNNSWGVATPADLDNDGDIDVAFHHFARMGWFENDLNGTAGHGVGNGILTHRWSISPSSTGIWQINPHDLEVLDHNLDGYIDFVVANDRYMDIPPAIQWLYTNDPNSEQFIIDAVSYETAHRAFTYGLCAGDYNTDGFPDLYACVPRNRSFYFRSASAVDQPNGHHWIGVRLEAENSSCNYRGLGATVIVEAPGYEQAQVVDGGSGRAGQHELDLVFGLGSISTVNRVRVLWPCGQEQILFPQAVDQYIVATLDFPEILDETVDGDVSFKLNATTQDWIFSWYTDYPSFRTLDRIEFLTPITLPGNITVYGLEWGDPGVVISSLVAGTDGRYKHTVKWLNVPCMGSFSLPYKVYSSANGHESGSTRHYLPVQFCVSGP